MSSMVSCKINKQCNKEKHNKFFVKKINEEKHIKGLLSIKLITN
jgi:hypothetical protein